MQTKCRSLLLSCFTLVAVCSGPLATTAIAHEWTQLAPLGPSPDARTRHTTVYDQATNRLILFGGRDVSCAPRNDTWVLTNANGVGGTPTWIQLSPTGPLPPARHFHSAVYDQATNRMTIFGGESACFSGLVNDVWVLSNANGLGGTPSWTPLPTAGGPSPRSEHSAVYNSASNRMIVFAGNPNVGSCSATVNDVWALDFANGLGSPPTWVPLAVSGVPPPARGGHVATYDALADRMIVFGGNQACAAPYSDVHTLAGAAVGASATWTQLAPAGTPGGRTQLSGVYSPTNNRMTIFGGGDATGPFNTTWVLDGAKRDRAPTSLDPAQPARTTAGPAPWPRGDLRRGDRSDDDFRR